jgi:hypothetical protein
MCCTDAADSSVAQLSGSSCGMTFDPAPRIRPEVHTTLGVKLKSSVEELVDGTTDTRRIRQSIELRRNSVLGQTPSDAVKSPTQNSFIDLAWPRRSPSLTPDMEKELVKASNDESVCRNFY